MALTRYDNLPYFMNTSDNDLIEEFYIPMMKESIEYKRGVGFFSSGWFKMVSKGVINIILNGGRIQLITSPYLSENDYDVLIKGSKAKQDEKLYEIIVNSIKDLEKDLEVNTLSVIAWMVADGILEIKLSIPRNNLIGDFHDKFGIFIDKEGNLVAFSGSPNESIKGFQNYESIKIFPSWKDNTSKEIAESELKRFEKIWNNEDPNLIVFSVPEAAKEEIIKLRKEPRPYSKEVILKAFKDNNEKLPKPRPYQEEAVESWIKNNFRGLFEMATGTGKTLTSIFALKKYMELHQNIIALVIVPYQHLVDQWEKDLRLLSNDIIKCYGDKEDWIFDLKSKTVLNNKGYIKNLIIVSTIQTASKGDLLEIVHSSVKPNILIVDECHYAGAKQYSVVLDDFFQARIGLSATPMRMWDEIGTEKIEQYFKGVIFRFPIEKAIQDGFLVPYEYHPILVELSEDEFEEYRDFSTEIGKIINRKDLDEEHKKEKLEILLLKRANVLNRSKNKLKALEDKLNEISDIKYSLFYCDPLQIEEVFGIIRSRNMIATKFTAEENRRERKFILDKFGKGEIEALVAIKCLDEGVDIPPTRNAFFLSSSTNSRQFIQRRGRILRKHEGKERAFIYDFMVIPPKESGFSSEARYIISRELKRFKEFADFALNQYQAKNRIIELAKSYNLLDEI